VPEGQDPDTIQQEIEQTRAELADAIDQIADRVSPRRAASRSAEKVRSVVGGFVSGGGNNGQRPAAILDSPRDVATVSDLREIARDGFGSAYTGSGTYRVERRVRTDRILMAVGVVAGVAAVIIVIRGRDQPRRR
jgi:hypothetical protein